MYNPAHFAVDDRERLFEFVERHSFGVLISQHDGRPFASHLSLLLDRQLGPEGTLLGHFARANPHWQQLAGQDALAIFTGPHAYVSPAWYAAQNVVPTWNYVAVHVYGRVELIDDERELLALLHRTVTTYESPRAGPWTVDVQSDFIRKLAQQVVGFRVPVTRWEGKWKLSQNHPQERRERVIAALEASATADDRAIAELMRREEC